MEEAGYPPAQHTRFVPVPAGAPLYLLANPPGWAVLLFPTSLSPKVFKALLGGIHNGNLAKPIPTSPTFLEASLTDTS